MGNTFAPVGAALPARRDALRIDAADGGRPLRLDGGADSIIVPKAQDRLLELIEREQLPGDVRTTLAGALTGDLRRQQLLFQAMIDTWPRLQKALGEVKRAVRKAPWKVQAWARRGEDPDEEAETLAKETEAAVWAMRPDAPRGRKGFEGTVEELAMGYFLGHQVLEVHWERDGRLWVPASTKVVPPRFYGYTYESTGEDRLLLDRTGGKGAMNQLEDFPPHRFLIAVNGGHPGHPTVAAPLRALATYWLAAVYGLKWLLQFAQLCGVPFRWAEYANENDKAKIGQMLEKIGTAGWGAFPSGTKLNFVEARRSAEQLPQKVLIELADEQCDTFILGQTLTSSEGDAGSRALGEVHATVRQDVIEGVCDFVGEILSYQLVPFLVALNYGESRKDVPGIWAIFEKPKDERALAERDRILVKELGMPVGKAWLYERHGVPVPAEGDELFQTAPHGAQGDPATGFEIRLPHETKAQGEGPKVEAADAGGVAPLTVDKLSASVLEGLTGVSREWLSPVRPFFERLAALAMAKQVTDEDFLAALEKARRELPELFDVLDKQVLEEAFDNAVGSAMLAGSTSRYER